MEFDKQDEEYDKCVHDMLRSYDECTVRVLSSNNIYYTSRVSILQRCNEYNTDIHKKHHMKKDIKPKTYSHTREVFRRGKPPYRTCT